VRRIGSGARDFLKSILRVRPSILEAMLLGRCSIAGFFNSVGPLRERLKSTMPTPERMPVMADATICCTLASGRRHAPVQSVSADLPAAVPPSGGRRIPPPQQPTRSGPVPGTPVPSRRDRDHAPRNWPKSSACSVRAYQRCEYRDGRLSQSANTLSACSRNSAFVGGLGLDSRVAVGVLGVLLSRSTS
jgi:hypothetical protein